MTKRRRLPSGLSLRGRSYVYEVRSFDADRVEAVRAEIGMLRDDGSGFALADEVDKLEREAAAVRASQSGDLFDEARSG